MTRSSSTTAMWTYVFFLLNISLVLSTANTGKTRRIAIITGGTRGIGSGISEALAEAGYDLLLTYNTNKVAATEFSESIREKYSDSCSRVECVGGDISLPATRDEIFSCLDAMTSDDDGGCLAVMVHNAGQYVGITSDNSDGLEAKPLMFGDGSLLDGDGSTNMDTLNYYHRMYGEAFVDLCERSLVRMKDDVGGALVGISSPGPTAHLYGPNPGYSMPGSGKCLMEYSMRIYALKAAERNINANIIVPGVTITEAWTKLAQYRGLPDEKAMIGGIVDTIVPRKKAILPRDIGNAVAFLSSDAGRWITGISMPVDGGLHLKR